MSEGHPGLSVAFSRCVTTSEFTQGSRHLMVISHQEAAGGLQFLLSSEAIP